MAKSQIVHSFKLRVDLGPKEIKYLKERLHSYLGEGKEPREDKIIRKHLWDLLIDYD